MPVEIRMLWLLKDGEEKKWKLYDQKLLHWERLQGRQQVNLSSLYEFHEKIYI